MTIKQVLSIAIMSLLAIPAAAGMPVVSVSDTISFDDGSLYIGEIADSLFNGYGKMIYSDSTVYEGEWENGLWNGEGELFYPDGDYYKGHFSKHEFSGYGVYVYADSSKYDGYWQHGMFNGAGTMNYADGSTYTGNWVADKKDGPGVFYDSHTGTLYKGYFEQDRMIYNYGNSPSTNQNKEPSQTSVKQTANDGKFHYRHLTSITVSYGMGEFLSFHVDHHISDAFFAGGQFGFNTNSHEIGEPSIISDKDTGEKITLVGWDSYKDEILTENTYSLFKISGECGISWKRFSIGTALGLGLQNTVRNCRSKESNDSYFEPGTLYYRDKITGVKFAYDFFAEFVPEINLRWIDISLRAGYSNLDRFHLGMGVVF